MSHGTEKFQPQAFQAQRFAPIVLSTLAPHTGYLRPYFHSPNPVTVDSSALEVMTDLQFVAAATVADNVDIDIASQHMIARGVRLLLVVDAAGEVTGLLTARDLIGERAQELQERASEALTVGALMTPAAQIEVMDMAEVLHARVGDIVATLKSSGRQHALVVDAETVSQKKMVRGIFSASQIARQLGIAATAFDIAQTFAQLEQAMARRAGG